MTRNSSFAGEPEQEKRCHETGQFSNCSLNFNLKKWNIYILACGYLGLLAFVTLKSSINCAIFLLILSCVFFTLQKSNSKQRSGNTHFYFKNAQKIQQTILIYLDSNTGWKTVPSVQTHVWEVKISYWVAQSLNSACCML